MNDEVVSKFLDLIRPAMKQITDIYLFGSRCREDWRPDSDYDILIVIKKKDRLLVDNLYDAVIDILLSTGRLISLKIFTVSEFNRLKSIPTPFIQNITTEGIRLGTYH